MISLLVGEPQVAHVLAEYLDAVGILAATRVTADLLDSTDNTQRHFHDVRCVAIDAAKVQLVVGYVQNTARWSGVWAQVGDFSGLTLNPLAVQQRWASLAV